MQLLLYSAFRVTDYSLFLIFLLLIKDQTYFRNFMGNAHFHNCEP